MWSPAQRGTRTIASASVLRHGLVQDLSRITATPASIL